MIKVLIIVVTRLASPDEFVLNWNTPKKHHKSDARYIPFYNIEAGLLLIHGRSSMDATNCRNIIVSAINFIENAPYMLNLSHHKETLRDFRSRILAKKPSRGKPSYLPVALIHDPHVTVFIKKLEALGCISDSYSLAGVEPGFNPTLTTTLGRAIKQNRLTEPEAKQITDLVMEQLDPTALQVQYIHEIKELLLAIYLDAAVMANKCATSTQRKRSEVQIHSAFNEILKSVRSTAFQKLKDLFDNNKRSPAIYMIADVHKQGFLTLFGDFGKCKVFWKRLASDSDDDVNKNKTELPDTQDLASDIQQLSESLQTLLHLVGTKKGVEE